MFFNAPLLLPPPSLSLCLSRLRSPRYSVRRSEIGTARVSRAVAASSAIVSAMRNVTTQFDPLLLPSHSRRRAPCAGNIAAGFERVSSCGLLSLSQRAGAYERVRACRLLSFATLPPRGPLVDRVALSNFRPVPIRPPFPQTPRGHTRLADEGFVGSLSSRRRGNVRDVRRDRITYHRRLRSFQRDDELTPDVTNRGNSSPRRGGVSLPPLLLAILAGVSRKRSALPISGGLISAWRVMNVY